MSKRAKKTIESANVQGASPAPEESTAKYTPGRKQIQDSWLEAFKKIGYVVHTCKQVGVDYYTWVLWMKDPEFSQKFILANQQVLENYEIAATQRAINGVERPVFQGGKQVGVTREYSDDLLKTLLRAKDPDKYREAVKHEFDGRLAQQLAGEFLKAVRRSGISICPHCKTDLRISEKLAENLKQLSAKLVMK